MVLATPASLPLAATVDSASPQWFRRLVTRYEYHADNFLGMLRLGCIMILLRY
ncbi:MAG: hypothetical protein ACRD04_06175 [Terriglobales bacterium]